MTASLKDRLDRCAKKGALSTADIAVWMDLSYQTVRSYRQGVEPYENRRPQIIERLAQLEKAISSDARLPIPLGVWKQDRKKYLLDIRASHSRK